MQKKTGFTLIELLVVVLIIGILSSIALPQYQKAVQKSRNAQLKTLVHSIAQAENVHYLANGTLAVDFGSLDLDLPLSAVETSKGTGSTCGLYTHGPDAIREGKNFQIVLNTDLEDGVVYGVWTDGPYKCTGFAIRNVQNGVGALECAERGSSPVEAGGFCEKLEQGSYLGMSTTWRRYALP